MKKSTNQDNVVNVKKIYFLTDFLFIFVFNFYLNYIYKIYIM